MIELHAVSDKKTWEEYILSRPEANFLQSWNWSEFHKALGQTTFPFAIMSGLKQVGAALLVKEEAKRGTYLTLAGGPILDWQDRHLVTATFEALKKVAEQENCLFIRFRPQVEKTDELLSFMEELGVLEAPMHVTADLTLQLDLTQSVEELLMQMRKNTRYEVRKAEKLGITVTQSKELKDIEQMYQDQLVLAEKHNFVPFSQEFWEEQFKAFVEDDQVVLFHSYLDEQLLASAFIMFYNNEAVYHYGTSTEVNNKLPGSYACQWAAIQEAKQRGCTRYNFWGIAPKDQPNHRYAGVRTFKTGFGGDEVYYLPAHDIAVDARYQLVRGFEWVRKKVRKL